MNGLKRHLFWQSVKMREMKAKKTGRRWPQGKDLYDGFEIARNTISAFPGRAVTSKAYFHEKESVTQSIPDLVY